MKKNIILVDDHVMFVDALRFLLQSLDEDIAISVASTIGAALEILGSAQFDFALLDYGLPGVVGPSGFVAIRAAFPDLPVAYLSGTMDSRDIAEAMSLGAMGWLSKTMGGEPLLHALRLMLAGERFVSPGVLFERQLPPLTARESEVAGLLSEGMADKEIADRLTLQLSTVKVHVKNLLRKYSAENRTKFALLHRRV